MRLSFYSAGNWRHASLPRIGSAACHYAGRGSCLVILLRGYLLSGQSRTGRGPRLLLPDRHRKGSVGRPRSLKEGFKGLIGHSLPTGKMGSVGVSFVDNLR